MHTFIYQIKDADFPPKSSYNAADTANGYQMMSYSHVKKDLSRNEHLKIQSCKLNNNKYMIASTQIANTESFAFTAVPVFKLLSRNFLFINKDSRNCQKVGYFLRK